MSDDALRQLAGELRKSLDTVIDDEAERHAAREELAEALSLEGPDGDRRLADVLRARPETREWMRQRDPALADAVRLLEPLGGDPRELGTYYVCPQGDFDFVRETLADEVPLCPQHHLRLVAEAD
jgi:hypothetical protein